MLPLYVLLFWKKKTCIRCRLSQLDAGSNSLVFPEKETYLEEGEEGGEEEQESEEAEEGRRSTSHTS